MSKRKRNESEETMEILWQTPANPPQRQDYIFRDGIRYVRPYYFEFISHAKNRWAGKTIVDLFADEFKGRPRDYYVSAVKAGRIQVDGQTVPVSYVIKSSQKISHFVHRHEPPVRAKDIQILHSEPDVLTICKPASVPVHPCGQYRKNTVISILQAEHDMEPLFPIHRLDRLVSGLLILARSASKADIFRQQIESGEIKKQYIARVRGVFPETEQVANASIDYNPREGKSTVELSNNPNGKNPSKGKAACTKFTRISTNGTQSLVLCEPITGRTHQIRVHLQFLGHPIANDMLYLSESAPLRSIEGLSADRAASNSRPLKEASFNEIQVPQPSYELTEDFHIDPMCTNCPNLEPKGYDGHEEGLWLHCVKYSGPDWTYECPYPSWASLC
ncbi:RNA pseudouridine synthase 7 isoform X2 [Andrographis paniculata]|uniref:RNA pseudouridine synthase 7 isoform X2 n=1 Tax=Andrographis paniculata TaxID=175694 RepID=UPI0021E984A9|nr:RNA pseudouridine synthase 7 isoform X2 [Andrographis paniculata]